MAEINWHATSEDVGLIEQIADRAISHGLYLRPEKLTAMMDVTATHLNGCPLDLPKLLDAPDFDFCHDVGGIKRHIDRNTGQLGDCFLPRCWAREG
jgi:hypothetical protein